MVTGTKKQSAKQSKENRVYKELFNEYIEGVFDTSVSIRVLKVNQYVNISITLYNGKIYDVKSGKAMKVELRPTATKELINILQKASNLQFDEFKNQRINKSISQPLPEKSGKILSWLSDKFKQKRIDVVKNYWRLYNKDFMKDLFDTTPTGVADRHEWTAKTLLEEYEDSKR